MVFKVVKIHWFLSWSSSSYADGDDDNMLGEKTIANDTDSSFKVCPGTFENRDASVFT